jgi:hypothetical protein
MIAPGTSGLGASLQADLQKRLLMRIYFTENSEPKVLPAVAAVLPAEKGNETLIK